MYVVFVIVLAIFKPHLAPSLPKEQTDIPVGQTILLLATSFVPLAVMILCVLGAIMFGLATPTEAAAVGALGATLLSAAYRAFTWGRLKESVYLTARTSAMVCFLFVGSATFAGVFSYLGGEGIIKEFVLHLDLNPITFLLISQLIIFLLGWPLEWTEIIIIFVPIFLPLLAHFNVDPLLFGILVALNLQTAFLSPPMAMAAYYLKGIAPPHVLLTQIFWGCLPFLFIVVFSMFIVYVAPDIALWLPRAIYGN
jgi:tripartite ATP-independent transporter DctM subunit